jgi:hypothetical protein
MRRQTSRNPLFHRRRFADDVIILCVRWYLRFKLSCRDMAEIVWELGVLVAPSTILRWAVRYAEHFSRLWRLFETPVGGSWRCDETYIKVGGQWMYLHRAVDELAVPWNHGPSQSFLSEGSQAARATSNHHASWLRTQPFRAPPDGHAQRIQLPLGKPG